MRRLLRKGRMLGRLIWRGWMHNQDRYNEPSQMRARETRGAPNPGRMIGPLGPGLWDDYLRQRSFMQMTAFASEVTAASPMTIRTEFSRDLMDGLPREQQNAALLRAYERAANQLAVEGMRQQQRRAEEAIRLAVHQPAVHALLTEGQALQGPTSQSIFMDEKE